MEQTINVYDFVKAFDSMERSENFSVAGRKALFEYLTEYEKSCGIELELDVIALCCEYSEFENLKEFQKAYGDEYETIEDIENATFVIRIDDEAFIIRNF